MGYQPFTRDSLLADLHKRPLRKAVRYHVTVERLASVPFVVVENNGRLSAEYLMSGVVDIYDTEGRVTVTHGNIMFCLDRVASDELLTMMRHKRLDEDAPQDDLIRQYPTG